MCNVLSAYHILGQTFIVGVVGYENINNLLLDGNQIDDIEEISYFKIVEIEERVDK